MENKYEEILKKHIEWHHLYAKYRTLYLNRMLNAMMVVTLAIIAILVLAKHYPNGTGFVLLDIMIGSIFCMLAGSFVIFFPAIGCASIEKAAERASDEVYGE